MHRNIIVWFRNDLRLHDNTCLHHAIQKSDFIYPVYCFDPRQYEETEIGLPKTGSFRGQFILESIRDLRQNLQNIGSDLIVRQGLPEKIIPLLAKELNVTAVYASREVGSEELQVEQSLETALHREGINLELHWQATLLHIDEIPWPVKNIPDTFTQFRKEAERSTVVNKALPPPHEMYAFDGVKTGSIPSLDELGLSEPPNDKRAVLKYIGGETAGLDRLHDYIWNKDQLKVYKETRNGLLGDAYSSKFSAWLSIGALSPRKVYEEIQKYEQEREKNSSTYWLFFELLWRDYFRFMAKKYGTRIFKVEGIQKKEIEYYNDLVTFERWKQGSTGIPFIDANMREINASGYMSNRGRQNVASFLVKDLKVNWTWGASYFETLLIDYDVCSNWGNWNYIAGVGNDPREGRYFNIMSQAQRYDPQGEYVRRWIPELSELKGKKAHFPARLEKQNLDYAKVKLGTDYPKPIVDFDKWMY
ncbi:deoxyribodipyrimidine photo-lyase [Catalinimonas alkaloidigena]|uniref:DASH family cryptochrome n=1 Tax=Catalinimonas alkaloidigena TaxID=1075417 RepID=UPI002404A387|nr:DASH family cryptochrome [Catalinimonas alkaloidigena]MDF9795109.1 deoxyribodipyrimidine photo-lyase [Catalinimonas alkaloidigena]